MDNLHTIFLQRCADLANLATSSVSPNPRVGAVLVYNGRIIGEGYHKQVGQSHAEVNCLNSVAEKDRNLLAESTLYVSLEPCCFHGRTPACTSLIIENNIPKVVIGQLDQTAEVSGQGVAILKEKGVEILSFPDFKPTERVAQARQVFAAQGRPYVLLKYARSADHFLAPEGKSNYWITGKTSKRLVHFWRSRTNAIVIGAGTLIQDNPSLDTRLYPGESPHVCIIDPGNKITSNEFRILAKKQKRDFILIQCEGGPKVEGFKQVFIPSELIQQVLEREVGQHQPPRSRLTGSSTVSKQSDTLEISPEQVAAKALVEQILTTLADRQINHITIEGGRWLLNLFILSACWDEARVFTSTTTYFTTGLPAPVIHYLPDDEIKVENDLLQRWYK